MADPEPEASWPSPSQLAASQERELIESLVAFDEAIRTGRLETGQVPDFPDEIWLDLEGAARGLLDLEAVYPRRRMSAEHPGAPSMPKRIGRFEIIERLGMGGFGLVFKGRDEALGRTVAVKVPRAELLASKELLQRFARESRAAASLDHPHIVTIYEAGQDGGLPYIAYAYCDGPSLADWFKADGEKLTPMQAASFMVPLARAIDHCHRSGILHRDIKPGNILLFPAAVAGIEGFAFTPKIADLGLAKSIYPGLDETATEAMVGTPLYMAPEQAHGGAVGPACDVYSLGATLYLLLCGRPPFVANRLAELLTQLEIRDPVPPSELNPAVSRDLNTICLKCLEKSPARRYASAGELADDLERLVANRPILARPTSAVYRLRRWCGRNRITSGLMGGVAVLCASLFMSLAWNGYSQSLLQASLEAKNQQLERTVLELNLSLATAGKQRELAQANAARAAQLLYASDLVRAAEFLDSDDPQSAAALLERPELNAFDRDFSWRHLRSQVAYPSRAVFDARQMLWSAQFSRDKRHLAVAGNAGKVQVLDAQRDYALLKEWDTGQGEVNSVAFTGDGTRLATAGDDGRIGVWDTFTGECLQWCEVLEGKSVFGCTFIAGDSMIVGCGRSSGLHIFHVSTGEKLRTVPTPHPRTVEMLCVSHDGRNLATAGSEGGVCVFNLSDWTPAAHLQDHYGEVFAVQFASDDALLVTGGKDGTVRVYDRSHFELLHLLEYRDPITSLTIRDDELLAVSDRRGVVRLESLPDRTAAPGEAAAVPPRNSGRQAGSLVGSDVPVTSLHFAADGQALLTADRSGLVKVWPLSNRPAFQETSSGSLLPGFDYGRICAISEPSSFVWGSEEGVVLWDVANPDERVGLSCGRYPQFCRYQAETDQLVVAGSGRIGLMSWKSPELLSWYPLGSEHAVRDAAIAADGTRIVALTVDERLSVIDLATAEGLLHLTNQACFAVSPDGRRLVAARHGTNECVVFDLATLGAVATLPPQRSTVYEVAFSSDGKWLASASGDRSVAVFETTTWSRIHTLQGHRSSVRSVTFSPDGRTLASGDEKGVVKLWHVGSGQELLELTGKKETVFQLAFSADGNHLAALAGQDTIEVFSAWEAP
jgi:eukaryotic-like serine/threonine-protein kinase